jgi:hypothetical protein
MTRLSKLLVLPMFAAVLGVAGAGAASAATAKADPMMADCMKKAKMETDAMKMNSMEKDCKSHAMSGAMSSDSMKMMPKKK